MFNIKPDREDLGQSLLRLSNQEYEYLKNGEVPDSDTRGKIENRARGRRDKLPERLEILFGDVEHLHRNGMLDDSEWLDRWIQWMAMEDIENGVSPEEERRLYEYELGPPAAHRLGQNVGRMMAQLIPDDYGNDREDVKDDLLLGFVQGLYPGEMPASEITEGSIDEINEEAIAEIIEEVGDRVREKAFESAEAARQSRTKYDPRVKREARETARGHIEDMFMQGSLTERVTEGVETDTISSASLNVVMDALFNEFGPAWYYPENDDVEEVGWDDIPITEQEVREVIEERELGDDIGFWDMVEDDLQVAQEGTWSDISPYEVLDSIRRREGGANARSIANELSESDMGNVPYMQEVILPELNGQEVDRGKIDHGRWSERPLVEREGEQWWLTEYGEVLLDFGDLS